MAYDKLVEGNRLFDASADTSGGLDADMNELQDQLLASNKALYMSVFRLGQSANNALWDNDNERWDLGSGGTDNVQIQLPLRAGQKITDVKMTLYHSGADTAGGGIVLYSQPTTPSGGAMPARNAEKTWADPWNQGGAATYYVEDDTSLAITVAAQTDYYIEFIGLGTQTTYVTGCEVRAQFGN